MLAVLLSAVSEIEFLYLENNYKLKAKPKLAHVLYSNINKLNKSNKAAPNIYF